jgi:hypothetical protein
MTIQLSPRRITQFLGVIVLALVLAQVAVQTLRFVMDNDRLYGLVFIFSLGAEGNFPAFYATFSLLFTAGLLALVAGSSRGNPTIGMGYWMGLALIFVFLSLDEMLGFHERLIDPVRGWLGTSGLFFYAWVIPYGIAVLAFAAVYARFLFRLPKRIAVLLVVAGILFVTGAIGAEMVGGWYSEQHGNANPPYVAIQTIEEVMEMVGILIFISGVLQYADERLGGLRLHVSSGQAAETG